MTARVLLVEDDPGLVALLRENIEHLDDVVLGGVSTGGLDALTKASELQPHVVVLDLMVHNPGSRLVPLLRKVTNARIFIWTAFDLMRDSLEPQVDGWFSMRDLNRMLLEIEELVDEPVPVDNVRFQI